VTITKSEVALIAIAIAFWVFVLWGSNVLNS
jgi:hypothetical protein